MTVGYLAAPPDETYQTIGRPRPRRRTRSTLQDDYWAATQTIARAASTARGRFERWRCLRRSLIGLAVLPLALGGPELTAAAIERLQTPPAVVRYLACSLILLSLALLCFVSEKARQTTFTRLNHALEVRLAEMEAAYVFAVVSLESDPTPPSVRAGERPSGGDPSLVLVEKALPAERVGDDAV